MKLSVIIPVYNSEKYLDKCIDSVLSQSFIDFELLLINDGSTDNSGNICDEYAQKDKRVKVFHQQNKGVSTARNIGIEKSNGEWLTFIDSDDWIEENYFEILNQNNTSDCIWLNIKHLKHGEEKLLTNYKEEKHLALGDIFRKYSLNPDFSSSCAKLFKSLIIKEKRIYFDVNINYGEDALFCLNYFSYCNSISVTVQSNYIYRDESRELSRMKMSFKNEKYYFESLMKAFGQFDIDNRLLLKSKQKPLARFFYRILESDLGNNEKLEELSELKKKFQNDLYHALKAYSFYKIPVNCFISLNLFSLLVLLYRH
ncbi:MAG: glycosyltransferase family 2 protein [Weeksellaceae bacterium]